MKPRLPPQRGRPTSRGSQRGGSNIFERVERLEFVEGFGSLIRKAREELGLTREELASLVHEKSSVIKKIENEELKPSILLARRLEKALKITILREIRPEEEELFKQLGKEQPRGTTLGDLLGHKEE